MTVVWPTKTNYFFCLFCIRRSIIQSVGLDNLIRMLTELKDGYPDAEDGGVKFDAAHRRDSCPRRQRQDSHTETSSTL